MNLVNKFIPDTETSQIQEKDDLPDIILLGKSYKGKVSSLEDDTEIVAAQRFFSSLFIRPSQENITFLNDLSYKLHFTYRTRFPPIQRADNGPSPLNFQRFLRDNPLNSIENVVSNPDCFTTDIGWGCMIRTGQSLVGNALQDANLGRNYNHGKDTISDRQSKIRNKIIGWFEDKTEAPFSLHKFVQKGVAYSNMKPGEWFGPAATSTSIKNLIEEFPECGIDGCVISVSSGDIFDDELYTIFEHKENSKILLLLGVKLGINNINMGYTDDIFKLLNSKYSVGIAGGRPSSSLYFFGYQGNELLYFDPHYPQPCLEESVYSTCNSTNYGRLNITDIDPSMLIGIFLNGKQDWEDFRLQCDKLQIINVQQNHYSDIEGKFDEFDISSMESHESNKANDSHNISRNDYVVIEPLVDEHNCSTVQRDEPFEKLNYKTQNIMVLPNKYSSKDTSDIPYDIEPVLVENKPTNIPNN
ncbi:similar to Saccharomyces cerevisiae YNL223W ATG4 Conserved cysteine protease required for autophagy [Maudiozyma barnettii]|uniref:Cysteine protease n=1 Tax=Maudiozyma barnettii TaxID=61262 RepID=A0A8H2ZJ34_9SACH|nr:cysteine protease ATG4 [Kazachstania barnettii]CAB4253852.1 similar to Saccharomyces cerevisiae YNL223W ATG4 Conserved cysteine protease required for autophagy [Kazachstania barnettii]CAD1781602.1 similar to Saccharomyces cerevisiae YNL223W ATG4 Conserved cysteine protease required for autophagy [Kazachstania barnettii]